VRETALPAHSLGLLPFFQRESRHLDNSWNMAIVRAVQQNGSERPSSMRQARRLSNGMLVTVEYNRRGLVVRETYYWSPDENRLAQIRASFEGGPLRLPVSGVTPQASP